MAVRLVFGATPRRLGLSVFTQATLMAVPGILLGAVLVRLGERLLRPLLFGVAPGSPVVALSVGAATLLVVTLATLSPASKVMRQDLRPGIVSGG
jgi:ABC-type antimicrobial peptide transport system permease subunit